MNDRLASSTNNLSGHIIKNWFVVRTNNVLDTRVKFNAITKVVYWIYLIPPLNWFETPNEIPKM